MLEPNVCRYAAVLAGLVVTAAVPAAAAPAPGTPAKEKPAMSDASSPTAAAPQSLNLKVDMPAPDFTLPMYPKGEFKLSSAKGKEAVVLYFYPEDDTPGCTKEACAFRDSNAEFKEYGAEIYGVSQDPLESHKAFTDKFNLPFPLLVDNEGQLRALFGMPDPQVEFRVRVTYVIDKQGIIRAILGADADRITPEEHVTQALEWVKKLAAENQSA